MNTITETYTYPLHLRAAVFSRVGPNRSLRIRVAVLIEGIGPLQTLLLATYKRCFVSCYSMKYKRRKTDGMSEIVMGSNSSSGGSNNSSNDSDNNKGLSSKEKENL